MFLGIEMARYLMVVAVKPLQDETLITRTRRTWRWVSNERYPLLSSSQSNLSGDDSAIIRGRLPVMNAMESGDSNDSGVEESSMPSSAASGRLGNLSRRAGGSSQVSMN